MGEDPPALPLAGTLEQELQNVRVTIGLTCHDSYGAGEDWRAGNHDDLVLATALVDCDCGCDCLPGWVSGKPAAPLPAGAASSPASQRAGAS